MFPIGRVLGFPVFADFTALLVLLWMALQNGSGNPEGIALGVLTALMVFGSVLVHELGHAVSARAFHLEPIAMALHGFGGLTQHAPTRTPGQGLLVTAAGPAAGLLVGVLLLPMMVLARRLPNDYLAEFLATAAQINIFWSLFNLLPMYPLDGGSLLRHGLSFVISSDKALLWSARVGVVMAVLAVAAAVYFQFLFIGFIGALSLMRSVPLAMGNRR